MQNRSRRPFWLISVVAVLGVALLAASPSGAIPVPEPDRAKPAEQMVDALLAATGPVSPPEPPDHNNKPTNRYAMAGGCYAVRSAHYNNYLKRSGTKIIAGAATVAEAEPFHFQATDLGQYLLYGTTPDFLSASDSDISKGVDAATSSQPGQIVGGVTTRATDKVAQRIADGEVGDRTGRGFSVVTEAEPTELADWRIDDVKGGKVAAFQLSIPSLGRVLSVAPGGTLELVKNATGKKADFTFEPASGCAQFPEVEINIDGPIATGATPYSEVKGYLDAHLHMMAFEFLGGRARCGKPWDRYGVTKALVDCPDHEPGGVGAVLENVLAGGGRPTHDTVGWPTFGYWPRYDSLTHEQVYYKWLERSWRGGQRMFVNLLVDNNVLCEIYPYQNHGCNEMDGVRLQAQRIRELERYIDAQWGGPGKGWFRIVTDPFQARRVMNSGKLAVVLGIEVSVLFDCGVFLEIARCDEAQIDKQLQEVYDLGVRQMELVNKFDSALSGVAGDNGTTGVVVNNGNFMETGKFWQMETCTEEDGHAHDRTQLNVGDDAYEPFAKEGRDRGFPSPDLFERDALAGGILQVTGKSGVAPAYPQAPHCNVRGLSALGEHLIRRMAEKGMIFDPDHMSARARTQAMNLIEELGYSGVVSSHGWADSTTYPRVYQAGGVVAPYGGGSTGFVANWRTLKAQADPRYYWGFAYGADTNGFGSQGGPRGAAAANKVTYPFTGLGGVTVHQQRSGQRVYDINTDGVAHYGLYPDWIEDLRKLAGDEIVADLERGPEAYLQMWERAVGVQPNSCLSKKSKLNAAAAKPGMAPEQVLLAMGQPASRSGSTFTYCTASGEVTVAFGANGRVTRTAR